MYGLTFEVYKKKEGIGIKNGMLKLQRTLRLYKNYNSSFYEVWSEAYINYTHIMVSLFEATALHFQAAVTQFYNLVLQLLEV